MTALESFMRYSETLLSSGTACDVTRSANSLHDRADELMKFDVISHVDSSLPPVNVTFTSSTLLDRDDCNLVGTITEDGQLNQYFSGRRYENRTANICSASRPTPAYLGLMQFNIGLQVVLRTARYRIK